MFSASASKFPVCGIGDSLGIGKGKKAIMIYSASFHFKGTASSLVSILLLFSKVILYLTVFYSLCFLLLKSTVIHERPTC